MATVHTPPIDLYAESVEDSRQDQDRQGLEQPWDVRPTDNGERDESAIDAGRWRLDQVLGW